MTWGVRGCVVLVLAWSAAAPAVAGILVQIDDSTATIGVSVTGTDDSGLIFDPASVAVTPKSGPPDLSNGVATFSFEFVSSSPPADGVSAGVQYHIHDDSLDGLLSDTLGIVLTGRTPDDVDPSNVVVAITFTSAAVDGLIKASKGPKGSITYDIVEEEAWQTLEDTGLPDLEVKFLSVESVPEPGSLAVWSLVAALIGVDRIRRRSNRRNAAAA